MSPPAGAGGVVNNDEQKDPRVSKKIKRAPPMKAVVAHKKPGVRLEHVDKDDLPELGLDDVMRVLKEYQAYISADMLTKIMTQLLSRKQRLYSRNDLVRMTEEFVRESKTGFAAAVLEKARAVIKSCLPASKNPGGAL